jgi:hypothetical protein
VCTILGTIVQAFIVKIICIHPPWLLFLMLCIVLESAEPLNSTSVCMTEEFYVRLNFNRTQQIQAVGPKQLYVTENLK